MLVDQQQAIDLPLGQSLDRRIAFVIHEIASCESVLRSGPTQAT
jgi:hypothetical protein